MALRRGALAVVEEVAVALEVHGGEAAAAQVARLRVGDGQHEGDRDRRIDRIAPTGQHLGGDLRGVRVRRCDRSAGSPLVAAAASGALQTTSSARHCECSGGRNCGARAHVQPCFTMDLSLASTSA